ncbi:DUF4062 domain-containing protein [Thiohalorhabdus denitrificans]|uniref:DUF4062 domain-containing protein n=1 Tax=Thiohalorhabdus denitrificans TaxID=381306 RepID=A0A1G5HY70_9GAMM|nr:DUF4062 domain-containing protein [Thiohalorhabdus denitrificans]SCY68641.1 protein of unknown function [Thiohalorhabdus denitrificans]
MDKRYQVFVSSTFADLQNERQKVIQALMEMDCIPAGMEIFPASDEEQLEFIKKIINDCDYYLLIIGGRYGTTDSEGLSYTEKEYDYAVEMGLPVIALLHSDPGQIPSAKTDQNEQLAQRLEEFREKVAKGRLVKFWENAYQLPGMVALSLSKTIKTYPAVGWVRADQTASEEVFRQVSELSKENAELRKRVSEQASYESADISSLAGFDDYFEVHGTYKIGREASPRSWSKTLTWGEIFGIISPYLIENPSDKFVKVKLGNEIFDLLEEKAYRKEIEDQCFQTIKIQLTALGLVTVKYSKNNKGGMGLFWVLTEKGGSAMMQLRAIKKEY